ncbi:MAG: hypothetical protein SXV54_07395 [Chloroflexota bacterium]|nr:hypothetical protein [Chloroflexota bacterium]
MSSNLTSVVCPVCNKDQFVQKVSAVVSAGTVSGTFSGPSGGTIRSGNQSGTYGGYTSLSGTTASDLVLLLEAPKEPKMPRVMSKMDFLLWIALVVGGAFLTFGLSLIVGFLCWLLVDIVIGDKEEERAKYAQKKAQWETARERWSRLYYCHRDGIVFDPVTDEYCQPADTQTFLFQYSPDSASQSEN